MNRIFVRLLAAWIALACASAGAAEIEATIGYLERRVERPPVLSNLDPVPEDEGLAGLRLGVKENNSTGRFLNHAYTVEARVIEPGSDLQTAARELLARTPLVVVNAPAPDLLSVADLPEAKGAILFNARAPDMSLRDADCRANVLHTRPSRAMLADALAQFASKKRWGDWAMIRGQADADVAWAAALERSAAKFRLDLEATKVWAFDADMRRSAASEVPLFTQDLPRHDLLVIADEANDFARYVAYHTWEPRPVAGSEGLVPAAWSPSVEQHGAAQLQGRFRDLAGRDMRPIDYAAWAAARAVGEAITRSGTSDATALRDYMLSDAFQLGGFKGRALTFRAWNGQMRQPIPLSTRSAVVALAPLEGFLHQRNELDTLGLDAPESECQAFTQ